MFPMQTGDSKRVLSTHDLQPHTNEDTMKKTDTATDDLRPEYDFSKMKDGVRGKYTQRFRAGTNIAKIDPDVAEVFADDTAVNEALRELIKVARRQVQPAH